MNGAALVLLAAAALGVLTLFGELVVIALARRRPVPRATTTQGLSILKPMCGVDDGLEHTLEHFARMTGPSVELLLGVKDLEDPAFPIARRVAARFPDTVRVVPQRGSPVMNPKVNQLITLTKAARFELLMVSDSNAFLAPEALDEIQAHFEDPRVACVANPLSGKGHRSFGALLDNLHLAAFVGAGQIAAKVVADRDLVIGKSMTLRRSVLERLGGFGAFGDYAAEDFAIGQAVRHQGLRTVVAAHPVWNVAVRRSVKSFFDRYRRWAVLQRTNVSLPTYLGQAFFNPWPLAVLAWVAQPSIPTTVGLAVILLLRIALDLGTARVMNLEPIPARAALVVPLKDVLLFLAWVEALFRRTILWRGNQLQVAPGGKLVRPAIDGLATEGAR
jgi:ceramide glucosyltransferase